MLDRNQLIITILGELGNRIDAWRSTKGPDERLVADYERLSMTLGRNVVASLPGDRQVMGLARLIDPMDAWRSLYEAPSLHRRAK